MEVVIIPISAAIVGAVLASIIPILNSSRQSKRKDEAIIEAARSIAREEFLIMLKPNEPIYELERRASDYNERFLRVRKHLEKSFKNV